MTCGRSAGQKSIAERSEARAANWQSRSFWCCLVLCGGLAGCAESAESPEVLVERGHLLESHGELAGAIDAYTKCLKKRPGDAKTYYDRGVAYGRLGQWKQAAEDYSRAIEHDPGMARAYNNRATAYAQLHDYERAITDFTKAISLDPQGALTYRNRGLAFHDRGEFNQAIEDYTVAIRLEPEAVDGPFERGNAYLDSGQYQKAVVDYDRAIAIDPSQAEAWLNRGEAYRQLGDAKRAQADTEKARQLEPGIVRAASPAASPATKQVAVNAKDDGRLPPSDPAARRQRALRVARAYLEAKGFHVEKGPAPAPFDLVCAKGSRRLRIEVQSPEKDKAALRFTREEIDAVTRSNEPTALVVVGQLEGTASGGGKVLEFIEDWKPVRDKLVPVVFEYPLK